MTGVDNTFLPFINHDGTLVVELDRALYGCIESTLLWHKEVSGFLTRIESPPTLRTYVSSTETTKQGRLQ